MKIIIGADVVPTKSNIDLFSKGDGSALIGKDLMSLIQASDFTVANLEVPLTDKESPIHKCGPCLIAPVSTINGYKKVGIDILTLANNHILDQGEEGLKSTISVLDKNDIQHIGAGGNLAEACKPYIFECKGKKIGIYTCTEHEFSIATENSAGANPFDPLESFDHVLELKKQCDYVIVLYHGGKEHYRYPTPNLQKVCRKFVDKGADLVVCQHSHCIGCEEKWKSGLIVYGQGNFIFDYSSSEYWQTSMLIEINDDFTISYIPIVKKQETVAMASEEQAKTIMEDFYARSKQILIPGEINKLFDAYSESMKNMYLARMTGKDSFVFRVCNKLTGHRLSKGAFDRRYSKDALKALQNSIECESHREIFLRVIEQCLL